MSLTAYPLAGGGYENEVCFGNSQSPASGHVHTSYMLEERLGRLTEITLHIRRKEPKQLQTHLFVHM